MMGILISGIGVYYVRNVYGIGIKFVVCMEEEEVLV